MTQEEKEVLIKDLCGRLPYGVKIKEEYGDYINVNIYNANIEHLIDRVVSGLDKMVLRPMSSMTEEEKEELVSKHIKLVFEDKNHNPETVAVDIDGFDWLNVHHFDYRGLIPKGLAEIAPEGMYST